MALRTIGGHCGQETLRPGGARRDHAAYFYQACAACGRQLRVRFTYVGQQVACSHCGRQFVPINPASKAQQPPTDIDRANLQLAAIEELQTKRRLRPFWHAG